MAAEDDERGYVLGRSEEVARRQRLLRAAHAETLPPAWATFRVACEA